jgi:hypothetical protein
MLACAQWVANDFLTRHGYPVEVECHHPDCPPTLPLGAARQNGAHMTAVAVAELCGTWWPAAGCLGRRNHRCTRPLSHRGRCQCDCRARRPLPTPKETP